MLLITHIVIAISTIILSSIVFFVPKSKLLSLSWLAAGATLLSGVILTVLNPSHLLGACTIGIIYFSFVSYILLSAKKRVTA